MEFINRTAELASLQSEYSRKGGSFVVVYGRRRTGKTTLIRKFLEGKEAVYYLADKQIEQQQILKLQEQLVAFSGDKLLQSLRINHWDQLFNYIEQLLTKRKGKKLVIVLDEFQYLAGSNAAFASMLQRYWDNQLHQKNVMLIICGSLISMMYKHALGYNAPLYGRRTAQLHIHPFRFEHIHPFLKEKNPLEKLEFYGLCGGIPRYLLEMNPSKSLLQNIKEHVLDRNKMLFSEPRYILNDELNETSTYFSLLRVIAAGNHKIGDIATALGIPNNNLTSHLDKLRELDIVERIAPVTEKNPSKSRKGLYIIKDFFFRFWFRYVFPYQGDLEMGNTQLLMHKIQTDLNMYMSFIFEEVCRQWVYNVSPFGIQKVGSYWEKQVEIDVVAINESEKKIMFGECKWSNQPIDTRILNDLKQKAITVEWFNKNREEHFILFSKSGFTPELIATAKRDKHLILVDWRKVTAKSK
ncbi:MAG: ATP-binding protein [Bacteroidia bacterium]